MVYYIRFVKVPEVHVRSRKKTEISCSFDIRNDLGEVLYTEPTTISATLFNAKSKKTIGTVEVQWEGNEWTRNVGVDFSDPLPSLEFILRLRCKNPPDGSIEGASRTLLIASTQSAPFPLEDGAKAPALAQRLCFTSDGQPMVTPWEKVGSSIYGHVWDAGVILASHIIDLSSSSPAVELSRSPSPLAQILATLPDRTGPPLRILELGAGVGIVSLVMAHKLPNCVVIPTDAEDACELLTRNVDDAKTTLNVGARITRPEPLHWGESEKYHHLLDEPVDIVAVSDCTYNASSVPALVKSIADIAKTPRTLIVIALKRRHEDESILYGLMEQAKFEVVHHQNFHIPDQSRILLGMQEEEIELYQYRLQQPDAAGSRTGSISTSTSNRNGLRSDFA